MRRLSIIAVVCSMALPGLATLAHPQDPTVDLRDQLLAHFSKENLLPVFTPRAQDVGDAIELSGGFYARRTHCFPKLKVAPRSAGHKLESIVLKSSVEGNFGIGLKRVVDIVFGTKFASGSVVALTFQDTEVQATSTLDLQAAFSSKRCPLIEAQVRMLPTAVPAQNIFVLQEVYYARKTLSVSLDKSADVQAQMKQISSVARQLGLSVSIGTIMARDSSVLISAPEKVPVAVRLAFLPRPVTDLTLGGSGTNQTLGVAWEAANAMSAEDQARAMAPLFEQLRAATQGKDNPLREL